MGWLNRLRRRLLSSRPARLTDEERAALEWRTTPRQDRPARRLHRWLSTIIDDALPMSPDDRAERDWTPISGQEQSDQRRRRLKLHMLEKRGKGGYR